MSKAQEVFNAIVNRSLFAVKSEIPRPSGQTGQGSCFYRASSTAMGGRYGVQAKMTGKDFTNHPPCFVGVLIPDESYDSKIEGVVIEGMDTINDSIAYLFNGDQEFNDPRVREIMSDAQRIHDWRSCDQWPEEFRKLAKKHYLTYPVDTNIAGLNEIVYNYAEIDLDDPLYTNVASIVDGGAIFNGVVEKLGGLHNFFLCTSIERYEQKVNIKMRFLTSRYEVPRVYWDLVSLLCNVFLHRRLGSRLPTPAIQVMNLDPNVFNKTIDRSVKEALLRHMMPEISGSELRSLCQQVRVDVANYLSQYGKPTSAIVPV